MFEKNLINICERNLKRTSIVITIVLTLAVASSAQNINDDLKPKTVTPKKTTASTKTLAKSTKKVTKPVKRNPVQTGATKPKIVVPKTIYTETSDQIINRFMNYGQSASVTNRDWTSVINQSQKNLKANPNNVTANAQLLIGQGEFAYLSGDYSNALTQFNSAAQVMPNSVLPFYCIGKVYLVTKQPNEAKSNFEKAIKLNSNFALAYSGLGEVMTAQGNKKKAKDYFQQAALIGMARTNTETTNGAFPTNSSVNNLNNGQNNSPSVPTTPTQQLSPFELDLKKARSLTSRKKWQDSLNVLMPLTKSSQTTNLYIAIGDNYSGMKQWLSAQQAYRKAVDLNPNSAAAFYKLGTVMFEVNEFQTAAEAFEKSLILDQNGTTINRLEVRKMADKANERARELKSGKKRKFLGIGFN